MKEKQQATILLSFCGLICLSLLVYAYTLTSIPSPMYFQNSHIKSEEQIASFVFGFNMSKVNVENVEILYKDNLTQQSWSQTIKMTFEEGDTLTITVPTSMITVHEDGSWILFFSTTETGITFHLPNPPIQGTAT